MSESNGDCSRNEDISMTGTVSNKLEKNIMNVSNGECSLKNDTNNKTGAVGNKFEKTVTNESNGAVGKELEKNFMSESNVDCLHNKDTSMTGTVSNKLEKNVMNKSSGDGSLNMDISKTGAVGKELERTVMNQSNGDCSIKDGTNNLKAFGKELPIANEIQVDKEVREDKTENDVIIETDRVENCDIVNGISGRQVVTEEKKTTLNSLNSVESGEQFHDSECDRSQIPKVTYDDKDDTCNSESHSKKKVNSSDFESSDDENLPLSKLKMISCERQDIGQVRNPITLACDADSTWKKLNLMEKVTVLILTKSLRDYWILRIPRVLLYLWKNTYLHIPKIFLKLLSMTNRRL